MKFGLILIGALLLIGGVSAVLKPKTYVVVSRPAPINEVEDLSTKAPLTRSEFDPRLLGIGAITFGGLLVFFGIRMKASALPPPHGNPLHHDF